MKFVLLAVICSFLSLCCANEDIVLDHVYNIIHGNKFQRRAVVSALSAGAIASAAKGFASQLGQTARLAVPVSQSFEDACLGSTNPVNPIQPWNPFPWRSGSMSSGISGGISSGKSIFGKRDEVERLANRDRRSGGISSGISHGISGGISHGISSGLSGGKPIFGKRDEVERLANRDIVFVLDSSGSIPQDQFDKAKKAINILMESFCPSKFGNEVTKAGTKQISVVLFDSTVTTEVDFSDSSRGLGYLQDKILSIKHRKGSTATGDALAYVKNKVLGKGSSRLNNPKVSTDVIVITDGQCNRNCRVLGSGSQAIRKMGHGVNVFAMGVANARACELEIITGKGNDIAYGLGDFRNFDRFATAVKEIAQENASKCA